MGRLINKVKELFGNSDIVKSIIGVNVFLFLLTGVLNLVAYLFNIELFSIADYAKLPASLTLLSRTPWSIFTYMFIHLDVLHLLFNMLFFYWFGQFFLRFFSSKHLRGLYVLGGLIGGIFFITSYHIFPILKGNLHFVSLMGASAAVMAVVIAVATQAPNQTIRFLLLGSIKLKYIALFVVASALLMIPKDNPGGQLAHLGGALAGFLFVRLLAKGVDLTRWINAVLDIPFAIQHFMTRRKQKMKVVKDNTKFSKHKQDHDYNYNKKKQSEEIDHILDKIKETGYENLSEEEKQTLFNARNK